MRGIKLADLLEQSTATGERADLGYSLLVGAIEPNQIDLIMDTETPGEAWKSLENAHRSKSSRAIIDLSNQLRQARMTESQTIPEFTGYLLEITRQLKAAGGKEIADSEFFEITLNAVQYLPYLAVTVECLLNGPVLKKHELINRLRECERRFKAKSDNPEPQSALAAEARKEKHWKRRPSWKKGRPSHQKEQPDDRCRKCGLPGHWARGCRSKGKAKECEEANATVKDVQYLFSASERPTQEDSWLMDSGASSHMVNRFHILQDPKDLNPPVRVILGNNDSVLATHIGLVQLTPTVRLKDVLYVEGLRENLLSTTAACKTKGVEAKLSEHTYTIIKDGQTVISVQRSNGMFRFKRIPPTRRSQIEVAMASIEEYHRQCGHTNYSTINEMIKSGSLPTPDTREPNLPCTVCARGKMTRLAIPKESMRKSRTFGELVHSDLCGPMPTTSIQGNKYMATYTDDATNVVHVAFLKEKSQQLAEFESYDQMMEKQFNAPVKVLRSDCGGEYSSHTAADYLKRRGIRWERSTPRTPQQNGKSERMNRTLVEMARCLLIDAALPKRYWEYAVSMAAYIRNRTPTSSNMNRKSPFEMIHGEVPKLSELPIFGSNMEVHIPDQTRGKLDPKSRRCIFLGLANGMKAAIFEDVKTGKRFVSRDWKKSQGGPLKDPEKKLFQEPRPENKKVSLDGPVITIEVPKNVQRRELIVPGEEIAQRPSDEIGEVEVQQNHHSNVRRSQRVREPRLFYLNQQDLGAATIENEEPTCAKEALEVRKWRQAMNEEFEALERNKTWDLVDEPKDRNIISGKWCFQTKRDGRGNLVRYKARYVARGFSQVPGADFNETFSPVVSLTSLRCVLAIAASSDMHLRQLDVNTAFLYGNLDEELYLEQPEGFERVGVNGQKMTCRLRKAIYGLKQAGRVWWRQIDDFLKASGFKNTNSDPCVYKSTDRLAPAIIALYVDDLVIAAVKIKDLDMIEQKLRQKYSMKPTGELSYILGIKVVRDKIRKTITMSQELYTQQIISKFGMQDCKDAESPFATGLELKRHDGPSEVFPYSQAVGSLMYLMLGTRPDIAHAVGVVSRYTKNPGPQHVLALKRIFRYLKGTLRFSIVFHSSKVELHGYVDADYAGDRDERRSTTGFVFILCGGPVSWASRRQGCVALSTTEAEYVALGVATREAVWLRTLLSELGHTQREAALIHEDNQGAIALAISDRCTRRTKHIDVQFHYVREAIKKGAVKIDYCRTQEMIADILTKAVTGSRFQLLRNRLLDASVGLPGGSVEDGGARQLPVGQKSVGVEQAAPEIGLAP